MSAHSLIALSFVTIQAKEDSILNEMRNKIIADGKYTDAVDEVLLKIIGAKQKKFKVIYKEA